MSLKIYAFPPSPRSFKVLAVARHLGLDCELRLVDLMKGEQRAPAFAAINPNMKVPVLEDDGFTLWESNAIIQYLARKQGESELLGSGRGRADVMRWMFWDSTTWDPACAILVFERALKPLFGLGAPDPIEVEKGLKRFHFAAGVLEKQLRGRRFICGEALTLADFAIGSALTIAEQAQLPLRDYPEITRWGAVLAALPAWRETRAIQATRAAA